jgi:signal transduction histidine kinase
MVERGRAGASNRRWAAAEQLHYRRDHERLVSVIAAAPPAVLKPPRKSPPAGNTARATAVAHRSPGIESAPGPSEEAGPLMEDATKTTAANKELEAFAYSVSHDLRAPLRGIDGFSKALLDDCQDKLDDTGRDYLNRVRAGTQRMDSLIDDLLKLSRLTRAEMYHQRLDLGVLGSKIAAELRRDEPGRRVDFEISPELTTRGDRALLEAALENLLRNAWKFTGHREQARIELGEIEQAGEHVFYVRDDGAGFDMAYVDKLFGAFQRLHDNTEFPGSGIGLAIVQRFCATAGASGPRARSTRAPPSTSRCRPWPRYRRPPIGLARAERDPAQGTDRDGEEAT